MKYWVSALTIVVSVLGIGYCNLYSSEMKFDSGDAGVLISALGVMVAALVGWQVFNAIEMRGVIREFDGLKSKVELYNSNQSIALEKVDNLHTAYNLFKESKNQSKMLSNRYHNAAKSAELFLLADVAPTDSRFTLAISQLERVLELSESFPPERMGDFVFLHKELEEIYKSIMKYLVSYKSNIEQLINDVNECHSKRQKLSNP